MCSTHRHNFLVSFIISVEVTKTEKTNLQQNLDLQYLYINVINIKVNQYNHFGDFLSDCNFFHEVKVTMGSRVRDCVCAQKSFILF